MNQFEHKIAYDLNKGDQKKLCHIFQWFFHKLFTHSNNSILKRISKVPYTKMSRIRYAPTASQPQAYPHGSRASTS